MRMVFRSYDDFDKKNSSNHLKLSNRAAIQIRLTWKDKRFNRKQWWAEYSSCNNKDQQSDTVENILLQVKYGKIYLNNPRALSKVFDNIMEAGIHKENRHKPIERYQEFLKKRKMG